MLDQMGKKLGEGQAGPSTSNLPLLRSASSHPESSRGGLTTAQLGDSEGAWQSGSPVHLEA